MGKQTRRRKHHDPGDVLARGQDADIGDVEITTAE